MPKRIVFTDENDGDKSLLINTFSNEEGLFYVGIEDDSDQMCFANVMLSKDDLIELSKELVRIVKSIK